MADIDDTTELNEENVKNESNERADLKNKARDKMADQEAREGLDKSDPVRDYDFYKDKYQRQGYSGDNLLQKVRNGSKTTNKNVNNQYGRGKK